MRNPETEGFVREEDTALGSGHHFTLDGFEGLGENLDQVVPPFVDGNYEDEIRARYDAFKDEVPAPRPVESPKPSQHRKVGVIGDGRKGTAPPASASSPEQDDDGDEIFAFRKPHFDSRTPKLSDLLEDSIPDVPHHDKFTDRRDVMNWLAAQRKGFKASLLHGS
ncbi:hypothetical protein AB5N19_04002 [Seiridium cardinale]